MIGSTWMDGRGQLFSEASAHIILYFISIYYIYSWADINNTCTNLNVHEAYPE